MNLTASERILLHVGEHWRASEAIPELTQKGIASGAGVRRSHVPRNLKRLISEGYIEAVEGRIGGRARRVTYYKVTEAGLRRARELKECILAEKVKHGGKEASVADLAAEYGITPLEVAVRTDGSGAFNPPSMALVEVPGLIEREDDIARLNSWARGRSPVMVVYGATGTGKTSLAKAFVSQHKGVHMWVDLRDGIDLVGMLQEMSRVLEIGDPKEDIGKATIDCIGLRGLLLVLDDYHQVSEDVVDFLGIAIEGLKGSVGKMLVLAQETTPSYCRFYGRPEVGSGVVQEMHIKGLSIEGCRKMLGQGGIDDEALKRIFLLTKGIPLYLDLIKRGDADGLRRRSRFTPAEIRLLMFSKNVTSRR